MTEPKQYVWKLTWHPKGADPKLGEVETLVQSDWISGAIIKLSEHHTKDATPYCVITKAERVGEWLL